MQTKTEIQKLLASIGAQPNRRLGQNFLVDLNLMQFLLANAHINRTDVVLEVGCGTGSLTGEIIQQAAEVVGVEYDDKLAKLTAGLYAGKKNFQLVCGDALENKNTINHEVMAKLKEAKEKAGGKFLLVANLPYNVAASVMANLLTGQMPADSMTVTVQKEVAQRMVAKPGSDDYGILSILLEAFGECRCLRKLPPTVFWPPPNVDSAIVRFERNEKKAEQVHNVELFRQTVNLFMGYRRKMLKACVRYAEGKLAQIHHWEDIFKRAFVEPHHRPEELSAVDYIAIANLCGEIAKTA